jgi:RNA polymerase sigma-70 factor, ECF subfamily
MVARSGWGLKEHVMMGIAVPARRGRAWHGWRGWRGPGMRWWRAAARRWMLALAAQNEPLPPPGAIAGAQSAIRPSENSPGPRDLLDQIYRQHARAVLAYLCHRLPSLADAEDVLAEVFVAAFGLCARGEEPGIGWLMVTARRRVADFYRRRGRALPMASTDEAAALVQPADPSQEPEHLALRAEERRHLLALVARLPEEQREVLALRFAAGLPSLEIATIIGKSDEATRAILSRAVRRLRKEWHDERAG